jgi:hypothetical protein
VEIQKRVLSIKYGEQSYEVAFPSMRKRVAFGAALSECKDPIKAYEMTADFLAEQGLPRQIVDELEEVDISNIVGKFLEKKS